MSQLTPIELQSWLEWAGARLIAMPGGRVGPKDYRVAWPEFSQDTHEVLKFRNQTPLRVAAPSSAQIPIVDEILALPNVCSRDYIRRVLHIRALVHPIHGRHLYPWTRIAKLLQSSPQLVKSWHAKGLREVVEKAPPDKVCLIFTFMQESLLSS